MKVEPEVMYLENEDWDLAFMLVDGSNGIGYDKLYLTHPTAYSGDRSKTLKEWSTDLGDVTEIGSFAKLIGLVRKQMGG